MAVSQVLRLPDDALVVTSTAMTNRPVQIIRPKRHGDARGWFIETYNRDTFAALGITCAFVQDKLVRCIRGRIFDVAVDVRAGSPTYGQWVGAELSAENGHQLFIPVGFAHGFVTLEPDCEVTYKCSDTYAPDHDGGIAWDSAGIDWPIPEGITPELSAKDQVQPALAAFNSPFAYDGRPLAPLA